jgi:hypothetical protein
MFFVTFEIFAVRRNVFLTSAIDLDRARREEQTE